MNGYPLMVGRVEEQDTIRAALDNCRPGGCPPVLIGGEAGIGKSHLVREGLRDWDGVVLRAASHPGDGLYTAVTRILRICSARFGEDVVDHSGGILLSGTPSRDDDGTVETLAEGFAATLRRADRRSALRPEDYNHLRQAPAELRPSCRLLGRGLRRGRLNPAGGRTMVDVSDAVRPSGEAPHGTSLLPADLTEDELDAAPVLDSIDALLMEELSEDEDDAFAAALES